MKNNMISVRVTDKLYERVQKEIDKKNISVSALICMAVSEYFEKQEKEEKK